MVRVHNISHLHGDGQGYACWIADVKIPPREFRDFPVENLPPNWRSLERVFRYEMLSNDLPDATGLAAIVQGEIQKNNAALLNSIQELLAQAKPQVIHVATPQTIHVATPGTPGAVSSDEPQFIPDVSRKIDAGNVVAEQATSNGPSKSRIKDLLKRK